MGEQGAEVQTMSRLISRVLGRDQIVERLTAHPFTLSLAAALVFAQATVYVAEICGVPFGRLFALSFEELSIGGLLFPLTHYAPVSAADVASVFRPLDFLYSLVLFGVCIASVLYCGPAVESYYGSRRVLATFMLCSLVHALIAAALPGGFAWSSLAFATFLGATALLIGLERRDDAGDVRADTQVMIVLGGIVVAAVGAGFVLDASYNGLIAAAGVGPVLAICAFMVNRRLQMRRVRRRGEGRVGDLYFVDESDLLTRQEIGSRMDALLAKIGSTGMESLSPEERRFLRTASQRLKQSPSEESRT